MFLQNGCENKAGFSRPPHNSDPDYDQVLCFATDQLSGKSEAEIVA